MSSLQSMYPYHFSDCRQTSDDPTHANMPIRSQLLHACLPMILCHTFYHTLGPSGTGRKFGFSDTRPTADVSVCKVWYHSSYRRWGSMQRTWGAKGVVCRDSVAITY